jgi:hypothetical protein
LSKLTRSNIAYDLNLSPHKIKLNYWDCEITYVFSSELYKNKFMERLAGNRASINISLTNRFGFTFVNDILSDLKLYTTIEKRGFLIYKGLVKIECLEDITLDGHKLITKS